MRNLNKRVFLATHVGRMPQTRKLTLFLTILVLSLVTLVIISSKSYYKDEDREIKLKHIDDLIKSQASQAACKQPTLPVNAPEIMKFLRSVPKIDCSRAGEDWVKCVGSECAIKEYISIKYGPVKCSFTDIIRLDDYKNIDGKTTVANIYKLKISDVVRVSCSSPDRTWSATLTGVRFDTEVWDSSNWNSLPEKALKMNVLMLGFDSLSRNAFIRKLPKSYDYLTKQLNTDVLLGYNIVGDGTPQALIPLLTGQTELELPDTRKRIKNSHFVNVYPFIWNDYKESEYVTGFFEDVPELSTFTYRLNGFETTPTDHYMRPYYLASLNERYRWPKLCAGEVPRHKVMLNAVKDFFTVYKTKPKFLFAFHGELSHDDYNLVGVADDDLVELLTDLNESEALSNTILILMADHGHRFAEVRNTIQGKQEERLPFFSIRFPEWFKSKHKKAYSNFKSNLDKLTTPFDIYHTLKEVLDMRETGDADIRKRSVSLFSKIPADRSCAHAYIEPHWCACLDWKQVSLNDPIVERLGNTLVSTLNNYTTNYRYLCEMLSVSEIKWAMKMSPNENLLKFNKNADPDGFVADLSADMKLKQDTYQIKAMLKPGNSLFEASIVHELNSDNFILKISDISRINMYGSQARCVEYDFPQLRKYCYCREGLK